MKAKLLSILLLFFFISGFSQTKKELRIQRKIERKKEKNQKKTDEIRSNIVVNQKKKVKNKNVFIRIYDLKGKKINKGKIKVISKTSIELNLKREIVKIPLSKIGKIKTKRSGGNNVAKGALIGGGSLAIIGLLSGDDEGGFISFSATDKASLGLIGGGFFGAIYGGISTLFKKSKCFIIDGNEMKLKKFKKQMIIQKLLIEIK